MDSPLELAADFVELESVLREYGATGGARERERGDRAFATLARMQRDLAAARERLCKASAHLEERAAEVAQLKRDLDAAEKRPCAHMAHVPEGTTVCWRNGDQIIIPIDPDEWIDHDCDGEGCATMSHVHRIDLARPLCNACDAPLVCSYSDKHRHSALAARKEPK